VCYFVSHIGVHHTSIAAKVLDENVLASGAVAEQAQDQSHHPIVVFAPYEYQSISQVLLLLITLQLNFMLMLYCLNNPLRPRCW
jgi:hypothetical protein